VTAQDRGPRLPPPRRWYDARARFITVGAERGDLLQLIGPRGTRRDAGPFLSWILCAIGACEALALAAPAPVSS